MMKKASKLLALCLSVLMLVSAMVFSASADYVRDYTAKGCRRITGETYYKDDGSLNSDYVYTFDDAGRLLTDTMFDYESNLGIVIAYRRQTYTYNENGDVLTFTVEFYNYDHESAAYGQKENWYTSEKHTYTYNADGTLKEKVKEEGGQTSELKPSIQYAYTYEGNVRTTLESHSFSGSMEITDKTVETLDANGNALTQSKYSVDEGEEELYRKYVFEYDANGNMTLKRAIDVDEGVEEPEYEYRWTYNDHGDKLSYTEYYYHSDASAYFPDSRTTWIYDEQYRMLEELDEDYVDGKWYPDSRTVTTYFEDAPERLEYIFADSFEGMPVIASESIYEWSSSLADLRLEYQHTYTLSADKLSVEEIYSRYDSDTQKFEPRSKTVVTITDDTYTSFSPKFYDYNEQGEWVEDTDSDPYRTDVTYDESNNVTSVKYFEYDSETSTWKALNSYAMSYSDSIYHTGFVKVDAEAATCDHKGHAAYYVCECGKTYYLDEKGENKIEDLNAWLEGEGSTEILPHEYDENGVCIHCGAEKPAPEKNGLSAGAIIAIILGSLILLLLIAYVVIFFIWKKEEELPEVLSFLGFLVPSYKAINAALFAKKNDEEK